MVQTIYGRYFWTNNGPHSTAGGKSAQIIVASKGGANQMHGGLFAFNRNAVGAARTHSVTEPRQAGI